MRLQYTRKALLKNVCVITNGIKGINCFSFCGLCLGIKTNSLTSFSVTKRNPCLFFVFNAVKALWKNSRAGLSRLY